MLFGAVLNNDYLKHARQTDDGGRRQEGKSDPTWREDATGFGQAGFHQREGI